jgi:hypothetical protein
MTEEIEVFVDLTDFMHEIGAGNARGPHYIYNSLEEIKMKQPCVDQCGIVRAKLVMLEIVQGSDYSKETDHSLSYFKKYELMKQALKEISSSVENNQKKIADEILEEIK